MNFQFNDVLKVQIANALRVIAFWVPIAFLYYQSLGYTDSQIFALLSTLQLFIVAMEYPTGVIGDVFGHKLSVLIGVLLVAISLLILGSPIGIPYTHIYWYLFLFATGSAFISGSDISLLYNVSDDFKKDIATSNQIGNYVQFVGMVLGGFIAAYNIRLPFTLTGIAYMIAFLILLTVKVRKKEDEKESLGIFQTAFLGMKESLTNMKLFLPIFISSVVLMYVISEKWVLPEVFNRSNIPLIFFGVATASVLLSRGYASGLYRKKGDKPYWLLILGMALSSILISIPYINILGLFLVYGFAAYITTQTDVIINEEVDSRARSSVVSFRNLLVRFINSPYLWILSIASIKFEFPGVNLVMTSVLLLFLIIVWGIYKLRTKYNVRR